jgi:hypothetical protein
LFSTFAFFDEADCCRFFIIKLKTVIFEIMRVSGFERNDKKYDLDVAACFDRLFVDRSYLRDPYFV